MGSFFIYKIPSSSDFAYSKATFSLGEGSGAKHSILIKYHDLYLII